MATTTTFYNSYKKALLDKSIDHTNDTIKVSLHTSSYTPNIDSHAFYSDLTNEVANGNGYTTGGVTLASKSTSQDNTDNEGVFDANDVSWTSSTFSARYAVLYKDTGVTTTSPLICYIDLGSTISVSNGTFGLTWNSEGIVNVN